MECRAQEVRSAELDEVFEPLGRSLHDFALAIGSPVTPGRWLVDNAVHELSFELGPLESAVETSARSGSGRSFCHWEVDVQSVTLRGSDGLELRAPARIASLEWWQSGSFSVEVSLAELPASYFSSPVWALDVPWARQWLDTKWWLSAYDTSPTLLIVVSYLDQQPLLQAVALANGEILGIWDYDASMLPPGAPIPYTPSEPLASACDGAEEFQGDAIEYTSFSSAATALEGITGTWARCLDHEVLDHAGVRVLPDGSWHDVAVASGELIARRGFGHEGWLSFTDASWMNSKPGLWQVNMSPFGRHAWASQRALVMGPDFEDWPSAVYLPTTLPVRQEPAPAFADGERVGLDACEQGETGMVSSFEETAATLTGEYVLCSGRLPGDVASVNFGESSLTLLREDGSVLLESAYALERYGAPLTLLLREGDEVLASWQVVASRYPRKLWIQQSYDYEVATAVFSALP